MPNNYDGRGSFQKYEGGGVAGWSHSLVVFSPDRKHQLFLGVDRADGMEVASLAGHSASHVLMVALWSLPPSFRRWLDTPVMLI